GTDRMTNVIETLLASARGDRQAKGSCDASAAAQSAVEGVADAARAEGISVAIDGSRALATVQADGDIVAHALHPLLENAVRHAASRVRVRTQRGPGEVTVIIEDDGPGLADGDPDALFSPGVSTTGGAGLGLSLARRLARSCGGDVIAANGGAGGRFELRLPAA
ncbi:MAG: two-component system, OmpR family, sensor kinase, partial [Solirubrobacteraceae bacterium]|nr:two-component system, OmpR family, sensor kinase [Solirubrobacteraceae bacterium]